MEVVAGLAGLAMGDYQKMEDVGDCESCGWELCGCKGLLSAKRGSGGALLVRTGQRKKVGPISETYAHHTKYHFPSNFDLTFYLTFYYRSISNLF